MTLGPTTNSWAVVGLGNPGDKYRGTRHNVGEDVVRLLAAQSHVSFTNQRKAGCQVATVPGSCHLALPDSYMNESGGPVQRLLNFYSLAPSALIVIHDEIDLPFGSLRVKQGGGDNGHNGLRSIRQHLGKGDYYRVRVGVGRGRSQTIGHVLGKFSPAERKELDDFLITAAAATDSLMNDGLSATQNRFNS